jgi:hypothetical protein
MEFEALLAENLRLCIAFGAIIKTVDVLKRVIVANGAQWHSAKTIKTTNFLIILRIFCLIAFITKIILYVY